MNVTWTIFKNFVDNKHLNLQYVDLTDSYWLQAFDGAFELSCLLQKDGGADVINFETNYQANANLNLYQNDSDGAQIVRIKAAKKGWSFWALPIEFTTSTLLGSVHCKDASGTNIPGITCKIYDDNNSEITTAGLLNVNLATCVKTVLDFEPAFDYEMIGGALRINNNPAQDVRLWIVGAPDIPAMYGGSKEFASGINLKFMAPDSSFEIDGRVTKYVTYNSSNHQGKLRIMLKHPAGTQVNLQVIIHTYRL